MTKRELKALARYVRWVADEMQLRDWTVAVTESAELAEISLRARVECPPGQRQANIEFAPDFRTVDPDEQRETVIHELVHAHHEQCWKMVQGDLGDALGKPVYYVFCDSYRRQMELCVDALSKSLATHMPLIDWEVTS